MLAKISSQSTQKRHSSINNTSKSWKKEANFDWIMLRQVDQILLDAPSHETLLGILQIVDPSFADKILSTGKKRESDLYSLNFLILPDKHPGDLKAKRQFQETWLFCYECLPRLLKTKKSESSTNMKSSICLTSQILL